MKNFEMAFADNPREVIKATQRAFIASMRDVVAHIKKEVGGPGMTWSQIEYFLASFEKKEPKIFEQTEEI